MFDRNKVYGYDIDIAIKLGKFPEDNIKTVDGDENDILTKR